MRPVLARLLRVLKIGVIIAAVVGVVRAIRGPRPPEVTGEARWPPLTEEPPPTQRSGPVTFAAPPEEPPETEEPATTEQPAKTEELRAWVEPVDGVCPASHPVKGNDDSGIYHVQGGAFYDRTVPERCYLTPEAAEADGYRPAKR